MFTRGNVLKVLGLIIIILVIWLASGYLSWLESPGNMFMAMAVPVSLLVAWEVFKRARAARANNQLTNAVVGQAQADRRPSADVVQLRERFEEAIGMLKQQKKRGGLGLYELPWYVIIGAPGAGKTTALKYSGLKFPLEQRSGKGALRGVGGTRNCDWWFTEEAVLLDTAGRYTTQDSDAAADSAGWVEFLALLKKYRKRRPLNGVLLAISAQDLMTQGQAGREAHVAAARRRLNELNKELRIQLPVYVLVTKCDLIAGFTEYFEDMSQQDRAQVLGVTFPKDVTLNGTAAAEFPSEFDAIVQRLNERVYARLEGEQDGRRRSSIFGFPQQLASLREGLSEFVGEVFETTRFDQRVLLRGVYFTSGTQEGTPIDRLLGALSRRLSVAAEAVAAGARGKAYFIERLMKEVILAESGLAGVSRRLELQTAVAQFGLYFGMLGAGALALVLLSYSYGTNLAFLANFERRTETLANTIPAAGKSAMDALPRMDQIRELWDAVGAYKKTRWWISRGWGLDRSDSIQSSIGNLYKEELKGALLSTVKFNMERRLQSLLTSGNPLDLYLTLRAYLMLKGTSAEHYDSKEVQDRALAEWKVISQGDRTSTASLDRHFAWLLKTPLQESGLNTTLVDAARRAIPPEEAPGMILARVQRIYEKSLEKDGRPAPPVISNDVFRTRSGRALGYGLPPVFTKQGFQKAEDLIKETVKQFRTEKWFWENRTPPEAPDTRNAVWGLYEKRYIEHWDSVLEDLGLPRDRSEIASYIGTIAGEQQGLKALLLLVDENTSLVPQVYEDPPTNFWSDPKGFIASQVRSFDRSLRGQAAAPGETITKYFVPIHWLVTPVGGKTLIDDTLNSLKRLSQGLKAAEPNSIGGGPSPASIQALQQDAQELKLKAAGFEGSAGSVSTFIGVVTGGVEQLVAGQVGEGIRRPYENFVSACRQIIDEYPFNRQSVDDVGPADLKKFLGPDFDALLKDLEAYVQQEKGLYESKSLSGQPAAPKFIIDKINQVAQIRQAFMVGGDVRFRFSVEVTERRGGAVHVEMPGSLFGSKTLKFSGEAREPMLAEWPAAGNVVVRFDDGSGRTESRTGFGFWNLFRLLQEAAALTKVTDKIFIVTLKTSGGMEADLRLVADSQFNPLVLFKSGALQNFRCDK